MRRLVLGMSMLGLACGQTPPKMEVHADLNQLMQGMIYPASNVVFAAQSDDPAQIKLAQKPSVSPNLLTSTFGRWTAVENSALSIVESANLLLLPGRKCSNGREVPIQNADWTKFVNEMREAGMAAYKAAKAKSQDDIVTATDPLTTSCSNCHNRYREKTDRCR
ncbi:MAG TPA: hypothetical protein VKU01_18560 [Bryobacteraceae bacterium]|nr:hypothetical protein [Bryobacteraceae bacterium]